MTILSLYSMVALSAAGVLYPIFGKSYVFYGIFIALFVAAFFINNSSKLTSKLSYSKVPIEHKERVIVVGGGVAGATVAIALANRGHLITLIERDMSEQDRIVGELLQPGGVNALQRLGLDDCAKDEIDSVMVNGYVIFDPASKQKQQMEPSVLVLKYPNYVPSTWSDYLGILKDVTSNDDRPTGRSFHNGRFVNRLREKAVAHPNIEVIEATVTSLIEDSEGTIRGVEYKMKAKDILPSTTTLSSASSDTQASSPEETKIQYTKHKQYANLTIVADGIWSSYRKTLSNTTLNKSSSFVGAVVNHKPNESPVPYPFHGHVILVDPSPCLIYQISSTETRVLIDILGDLPSSSNGDLQKYILKNVAPQMPKCFQESFITTIETKELKSMPNRYCHAEAPTRKGALLIGDALNMRHPLTGGGMTVAIRDAELFASIVGEMDFSYTIDGHDHISTKNLPANFYHNISNQYSQFLEERKGYASTLNILSVALHRVFSTPESCHDMKTRGILRKACFDYLSLGGAYSAGPVGLLAGLTPVPDVLIAHFFMVAMYSAKMCFYDDLQADSLYRMYNILRVACSIIMPLIAGEQSSLLNYVFFQCIVSVLFPPVEI